MFEEKIEMIRVLDKKPTLLLHSCCAPCSSAVLEFVKDYFDVTLYFYNPNISPEIEFDLRLNELYRLVNEMKLENVKILVPSYDNDKFEYIAKGLENAPEGGTRCEKCFYLRLENAVSYAAANGYDYVTTTLTVSPHKNSELLNTIGIELGEKYGVKYLCSDFKKREGYKRSCQLSREYDLYRQNYCGCIYSKNLAETNI